MPETMWSIEQKLDYLMRLSWTIAVERDATDGSLFATVAEMPDAIADAADERELARELWDALSSSLRVRLEHGDSIPTPAGAGLPWDIGVPAPLPRRRLQYRNDARMSSEPTTSATSDLAVAGID